MQLRGQHCRRRHWQIGEAAKELVGAGRWGGKACVISICVIYIHFSGSKTPKLRRWLNSLACSTQAALQACCLLHAILATIGPYVAVLHCGVFQVPGLPPCSTPPTHPCSRPQSPLPCGAVPQVLQHVQQCSRPPARTSQLNPATTGGTLAKMRTFHLFEGGAARGASCEDAFQPSTQHTQLDQRAYSCSCTGLICPTLEQFTATD